MISRRKQSGNFFAGVAALLFVATAAAAVGLGLYYATKGGTVNPVSEISEAMEPDGVKDLPEDGDNCKQPGVLC